MLTQPEQLEFSGFKCPACKYDLRGLPRQVCPECGVAFELTDETSFHWRPIVGIFVATASLLIGLATTLLCIASFSAHVNELGSWCGTARAAAFMALVTEGTLGTFLTCAMLLIARKVGYGSACARFAYIVTSTTLIVALAIVLVL